MDTTDRSRLSSGQGELKASFLLALTGARTQKFWVSSGMQHQRAESNQVNLHAGLGHRHSGHTQFVVRTSSPRRGWQGFLRLTSWGGENGLKSVRHWHMSTLHGTYIAWSLGTECNTCLLGLITCHIGRDRCELGDRWKTGDAAACSVVLSRLSEAEVLDVTGQSREKAVYPWTVPEMACNCMYCRVSRLAGVWYLCFLNAFCHSSPTTSFILDLANDTNAAEWQNASHLLDQLLDRYDRKLRPDFGGKMLNGWFTLVDVVISSCYN